MSATNFFRKVLSSPSFSNFSAMYFKYLKVTGGVGSLIGIGASLAHLLDNRKRKIVFQKHFLKKANVESPDELELSQLEEYERYDSSNLYSFGILVAGPLIGSSCGIMWPAIVVFGPVYYIFGDYLGPIVTALLTISASIVDEDRKRIDDQKKD